MPEKTDPAVDAAAVKPTTEVVNPAGTPAPVAVDAAAKGAPAIKADAAIDWKAKAEHLEAESKKAFAERDRAKQERDTLAAKAKGYDDLQAEKALADENALKEQGKWKELHEKVTAENEALKASIADRDVKAVEAVKISNRARAGEALLAAYDKLGGVDREAFAALTTKYLDDGSVAVGEDGKVKGVADVLRKFVAAKPHLFTAGKTALERAAKLTDGMDGQAALDGRNHVINDGMGPISLMEMALGRRYGR